MKTTKKEPHFWFGWKRVIQILLVSLIIFCLVYLGFRYLFSKNYITGPSMQPNFSTGDHVISLKLASINRGDVIILKAPDEKNSLYVKRVIGLPGDKIISKDDKLYINGKRYYEKFLQAGSKLREPFNNEYGGMPYTYTYSFSITSLAQTPDWQKVYSKKYLLKLQKTNRVPKNKYFVMGDHRTVSKDSRMIGFINKKAIVGRVSLKYWPLDRFSTY